MQNKNKNMRLPGVEPGSIAWKAIILTVGLQTLGEKQTLFDKYVLLKKNRYFFPRRHKRHRMNISTTELKTINTHTTSCGKRQKTTMFLKNHDIMTSLLRTTGRQ